MDKKLIITVGRTFGSGGRVLGRMLAERLGIAFYDKRLLMEAARQAGVAPEYFERNDERKPRFISGVFSFAHGYSPMAWYNDPTSISSDSIYKAQCDYIRHVAATESCVIVGRTADYVLRDVPGVINIFVHAPESECIRRIIERHDALSIEQARALARRANKARAAFYNFYTDKTWGQAAGYDLTLDSSLLPMSGNVDLVETYIRARMARPAKEYQS
ncbi:MAG: cytidylate kinase-like family protein [Bacteroides sp.]|nr:cytidylate kinase-like family protein [Bacteroides sp.]MDE6042402.1 cytidylate kinase-like family protein [Muribaculaceae bacterium]